MNVMEIVIKLFYDQFHSLLIFYTSIENQFVLLVLSN